VTQVALCTCDRVAATINGLTHQGGGPEVCREAHCRHSDQTSVLIPWKLASRSQTERDPRSSIKSWHSTTSNFSMTSRSTFLFNAQFSSRDWGCIEMWEIAIGVMVREGTIYHSLSTTVCLAKAAAHFHVFHAFVVSSLFRQSQSVGKTACPKCRPEVGYTAWTLYAYPRKWIAAYSLLPNCPSKWVNAKRATKLAAEMKFGALLRTSGVNAPELQELFLKYKQLKKALKRWTERYPGGLNKICSNKLRDCTVHGVSR
jgi:hypothetical protein